jgi:hypothetical protein
VGGADNSPRDDRRSEHRKDDPEAIPFAGGPDEKPAGRFATPHDLQLNS